MNLNLTTATGKESKKTIEVSETTFGRDYNEAMIHQVVTAFLAGARSGTRRTKSRSDVRGGGAKPWNQKGTGRARAGTNCSPLWRTGGMTFAVRPQDHSQKVNKKMYRNAISSIFSELIRQERLVVVDSMKLETPKTKAFSQILAALGCDDVLIVTDEFDANLELASRNLYKVGVCLATQIDPVSLVGSNKVVITAKAMGQIEEMLK